MTDAEQQQDVEIVPCGLALGVVSALCSPVACSSTKHSSAPVAAPLQRLAADGDG